jgi:hypothetical protein
MVKTCSRLGPLNPVGWEAVIWPPRLLRTNTQTRTSVLVAPVSSDSRTRTLRPTALSGLTSSPYPWDAGPANSC